MSVVIGLTVDVPGDSPDLGGDVLQQSGVAHLFFEERTVDGGEGFDGDKEVGAGGAPGRAVLGEATARARCSGYGGGTGVACPRCAGPR